MQNKIFLYIYTIKEQKYSKSFKIIIKNYLDKNNLYKNNLDKNNSNKMRNIIDINIK